MKKLLDEGIVKNGINKTDIPKDENGYYKVVLGAFNTFNRNGIYYRVTDVNRILGPNAYCMRLLRDGRLIAEMEHPDFSGMSKAQAAERVLFMDETRKAAHIKRIEIYDTGKREPGFQHNILLVIGYVKPEGPFGDILKEALENPDENVYFSIRALSKQSKIGKITVRDLAVIGTWDYVSYGGIPSANQWQAAALESADIVLDEETIEGLTCSLEDHGCPDGKCVVEVLKDLDLSDKSKIVMEW